MRTLLLAALLLVLRGAAPSMLPAQDSTQTASYPFEEWRAMLLAGVTLTPAQQERVVAIARATLLRMRALQPLMAHADDATRQRRLRELRLRQAEDIRAILTPPQRAVLQRNLDAWTARTRGAGEPPALA